MVDEGLVAARDQFTGPEPPQKVPLQAAPGLITAVEWMIVVAGLLGSSPPGNRLAANGHEPRPDPPLAAVAA
jgi:hypothetical protein